MIHELNTSIQKTNFKGSHFKVNYARSVQKATSVRNFNVMLSLAENRRLSKSPLFFSKYALKCHNAKCKAQTCESHTLAGKVSCAVIGLATPCAGVRTKMRAQCPHAPANARLGHGRNLKVAAPSTSFRRDECD